MFSGVESWQREIKVVTGFGGGDCGYPSQPGAEYVVYAVKNADGRLETGICSRTRPLAQAAEDLRYFQARAGVSTASEIRVRTGLWGVPGKSGNIIVAEPYGAHLILRTDLPVTKIAEIVGYAEIGKLCKAFRRFYGVSATDFRRFLAVYKNEPPVAA